METVKDSLQKKVKDAKAYVLDDEKEKAMSLLDEICEDIDNLPIKS